MLWGVFLSPAAALLSGGLVSGTVVVVAAGSFSLSLFFLLDRVVTFGSIMMF